MNKPVLVILAAGMGSRYGGLKQIEPVDSEGHLLIDFSIYDAVQAGFSQIVCIIKEEMQEEFDLVIGNRLRRHVPVVCVHQSMTDLPMGYTVPEGRIKPWGTSQAVLACRDVIDGPFAVLNADDYYGPEALHSIFGFLNEDHKPGEYAMVGYRLQNTLTDHGAVTRGVCVVSETGMLEQIEECKGVRWGESGPVRCKAGVEVPVAADAAVSMNLWGFGPEIIPELARRFPGVLDEIQKTDPLKGEFLLPTTVESLLQEKCASVRVLPSASRWFGVTYKEDKPIVEAAIARLKAEGLYPRQLWG